MNKKIKKFISFLLVFCFLFQQTGFAQVAPQLNIAGYMSQLRNSFVQDKFRPLHLRYLSYDNLQNNFKLFLDKGDLRQPDSKQLEGTTDYLLSYFLVGVSLPNESFWVNLRPDSPNNVIDSYLAKTDVGKILLEADLQLKKDTALATSPSTPEGKEYWNRLYKKAGELFGPGNVTIPTLTRPWIVPGDIIISETETNAYIYKATLKVMLEQDYLKGSSVYKFDDQRMKTLNEYASELIRELIIPKLNRDINNAKRYAPLRQVYYSLIMAQWFKNKFEGRPGLYSRLINTKNLKGLTSKKSWNKDAYFKEYQKSFKEGEYNIKEPVYSSYGQMFRNYFSGGIMLSLGAGSGMGVKPPVVVECLRPRDNPEKINFKTGFAAQASGGSIDSLSPSETEIITPIELLDETPSLVETIQDPPSSLNTEHQNVSLSQEPVKEPIIRRSFIAKVLSALAALGVAGSSGASRIEGDFYIPEEITIQSQTIDVRTGQVINDEGVVNKLKIVGRTNYVSQDGRRKVDVLIVEGARPSDGRGKFGHYDENLKKVIIYRSGIADFVQKVIDPALAGDIQRVGLWENGFGLSVDRFRGSSAKIIRDFFEANRFQNSQEFIQAIEKSVIRHEAEHAFRRVSPFNPRLMNTLGAPSPRFQAQDTLEEFDARLVDLSGDLAQIHLIVMANLAIGGADSSSTFGIGIIFKELCGVDLFSAVGEQQMRQLADFMVEFSKKDAGAARRELSDVSEEIRAKYSLPGPLARSFDWAEQILVVGVLTAVNPSLGSLVLSRRNLLGLKGDTKSAASSPVGSQNKKDSLIARRGFLGRIGLVVAALLFGRVSPAGESRGLFGLFSADELPQKLADELEKIAGESTHPDIGTSGFWRSRFQTDDLTAMRMARLYRQHAEPVRSLQHSQSQSVFIRAVAGSIRNEQRRFLENRKDGLFEKDGRIYRIISTTLYTSKDGSQKAQVLRVVAPAGETSGNWFGVHYFQLGNVVIINNTAINEGVKNQLMPLVSGNIPAGSSREGISDALAKELNSALSGILSKALGSMSEQEVGQVVEDYLIEHEAEHLFNENINFMSSVLSSRAFRNKAEVLLQKVLGVQDISEETEVIADELDAQLTELSGSYPQLWLMPSGEDTHPDSSVRSLIWGELCGFDIRAGNRNEGNLRRVRDFLSRLSRQDRVQVRTFLNNKSRQIRAKYSLPDSLASINNLAAPFFVGAGITAIRSTVNSPNLSRRAFLSLGAADKQSTSSPVDSALSARDAASEDNVWPSIIRMSTEANRLEYSLSAVDELSQSLQIRRPVIYDIGVGWAGEGGPVTTRELADTLKGRAQVFGIGKQIPYCVVYTPELTVLFDENNNILSWNRHQDNRLVFHTGETLSAAQKAEALDLVTGLRAAAERTLAKRISDFLRRALGMQGAYEYKSGKNRIVFNPIKSYENKNLKFAKGDLFNLGDSLGAQGLPRADIVRISNVLMPHFISKRESRQQNMSAMSEVLNSLLPFTQESGYVIVTYVPTEGIVPLSPGEEGVVYRKHNGRFIFDGYIFSVRTAVYANLGNIADFASQQAFDSPVKKANLLGEAVNEAGRRDAELWEFLTTGGTRKFGHGAELDAAEKEFNRKFGEVIVDVLATHGIQAQAWGSMVRVSYEDYSAQDTSMKKDFMGAIRKDFLDKGMPLDVGVAQEILRPLAVASSPIDEQGSEQGDGALPEMHFNLSAPRAAARNAVAILNPEQIHEMDLGVAMIVRHIQTKAPFIYTRWLRNLGFTPVANARQLYSDMSYIASGNNKHAYYTEVVDEKGNRDSFIFATKLNTDRNEALFESGEQDMLERLQGTPWVPRFAGVAYIEINPNGGFGEVYTDHRYIRTERMATVAVEELIEGPTVASIADANANLSIDIAKKCLASLLNIFFFLNEGRSGNFEGPSDFHFNNIIISERDGKQIAVVVDLGPKKQYRNLEDFVLEIMQWYGDDKAGQALGALYDIDNWPGKYSRSAYFWDSWLKDFSAYCHSHNNRRYRKFAYIVDRFLLHERGINLFRGGRNREPGPSSASSPVSLRETVLMGLDAIGRAITEGSVLIKTGDREEDTFVLTRRQLIAGSIAGLGTIFGAGVGLSLLGGKNRQQVSYAPKPPDPATVSVETQIFSWDQGYDQNAQAYLDFENRTSLPAELQHSRYGVNRSGNHNLNNLYYAAMYALLAGVDPVFAIAHYIQEGRTDFGGNYIVQGRAVDGDFWRDTVAPRYLKAHEGQDVKNNPSIDDIVLDPLVGPFVYRRILEEKLVDYPNQLARKGNDFVAVPDAKTIEQAAKSLQLYQGWGWVSKAQTGRKSIDYTKGENKYQYGYSLLALMSLLQQGDNKAIVDDIISRAQEAVPARLREILGELNGTQSVFKIDVAKLKAGASSPIQERHSYLGRDGGNRLFIPGVISVVIHGIVIGIITLFSVFGEPLERNIPPMVYEVRFSLEHNMAVPESVEEQLLEQKATDIPDMIGRRLGAGQKYDIAQVGSLDAYHVFSQDFQQQDAMFDRFMVYSEHPEHRGQVLTDTQLGELFTPLNNINNDDFGKRQHYYTGMNVNTEKIAEVLNAAQDSGIALNDAENNLVDDLQQKGLLVREGNNFVAKSKAAIIGTPQVLFRDDAKMVMDHELGHALYETDPTYRQQVHQIWDSLSPQDKESFRQLLDYFGYHPDVFETEFAEYLVDPDLFFNRLSSLRDEATVYSPGHEVENDKRHSAFKIMDRISENKSYRDGSHPGGRYLKDDFRAVVEKVWKGLYKAKTEAFKRANISSGRLGSPEFEPNFDFTRPFSTDGGPVMAVKQIVVTQESSVGNYESLRQYVDGKLERGSPKHREASALLESYFSSHNKSDIYELRIGEDGKVTIEFVRSENTPYLAGEVQKNLPSDSSYDARQIIDGVVKAVDSHVWERKETAEVKRKVNLGGEEFELHISIGPYSRGSGTQMVEGSSVYIGASKPGEKFDDARDVSVFGKGATVAEAMKKAQEDFLEVARQKAVDLSPQQSFSALTFNAGIAKIGALLDGLQKQEAGSADGSQESFVEVKKAIIINGQACDLHFIQRANLGAYEAHGSSKGIFETKIAIERDGKTVGRLGVRVEGRIRTDSLNEAAKLLNDKIVKEGLSSLGVNVSSPLKKEVFGALEKAVSLTDAGSPASSPLENPNTQFYHGASFYALYGALLAKEQGGAPNYSLWASDKAFGYKVPVFKTEYDSPGGTISVTNYLFTASQYAQKSQNTLKAFPTKNDYIAELRGILLRNVALLEKINPDSYYARHAQRTIGWIRQQLAVLRDVSEDEYQRMRTLTSVPLLVGTSGQVLKRENRNFHSDIAGDRAIYENIDLAQDVTEIRVAPEYVNALDTLLKRMGIRSGIELVADEQLSLKDGSVSAEQLGAIATASSPINDEAQLEFSFEAEPIRYFSLKPAPVEPPALKSKFGLPWTGPKIITIGNEDFVLDIETGSISPGLTLRRKSDSKLITHVLFDTPEIMLLALGERLEDYLFISRPRMNQDDEVKQKYNKRRYVQAMFNVIAQSLPVQKGILIEVDNAAALEHKNNIQETMLYSILARSGYSLQERLPYVYRKAGQYESYMALKSDSFGVETLKFNDGERIYIKFKNNASSPIQGWDEAQAQAAERISLADYLGMIGQIKTLSGLAKAALYLDSAHAKGYLKHIIDAEGLSEIDEALYNRLVTLAAESTSISELRSVALSPNRYLGSAYPLRLSQHLGELDALADRALQKIEEIQQNSQQGMSTPTEEQRVAKIKLALGEYILNKAGSSYVIDDVAADSLAWRIYRVQEGGFNIQELNIRDLSRFPGVLSEADIPSLAGLGKASSSPVRRGNKEGQESSVTNRGSNASEAALPKVKEKVNLQGKGEGIVSSVREHPNVDLSIIEIEFSSGTEKYIWREIKDTLTRSSSPVQEKIVDSQPNGKGGIDFRALPIVTQPMISPTLGAVPLKNPVIAAPVALGKEWQEIEDMINGGIIPSSERIKDYLSKCCKEDCLEGEIDRVLACVAQILRLEEERIVETDSSVQQLLVLLESNKSAQELKYDLIEISVSPKEPKSIE